MAAPLSPNRTGVSLESGLGLIVGRFRARAQGRSSQFRRSKTPQTCGLEVDSDTQQPKLGYTARANRRPNIGFRRLLRTERTAQKRLLFVSPRFLFPLDSGGKIRTTQILRGLRAGTFHITLTSPRGSEREHAKELLSVCDRFVPWPAADRGSLFRALRVRYALSYLPVSVASDRSRAALSTVRALLAEHPDIAVFDFAH